MAVWLPGGQPHLKTICHALPAERCNDVQVYLYPDLMSSNNLPVPLIIHLLRFFKKDAHFHWRDVSLDLMYSKKIKLENVLNTVVHTGFEPTILI